MIVLTLVWVTATIGHANPPELTANSFTKELNAKGEAAVLIELRNDQKKWELLLSKIAVGETAWAEIGLRLWKHSDTSAATDLADSLIEALGHSPQNVLTMLPEDSLELFCSIMKIEGSPYKDLGSTITAAKELEGRIEKLSQIKTKKKRDLCVKYLRDSEKSAKEWFKN